MKTLIRFTLALLPFASFAQKSGLDAANANTYTTYAVEVHVPDSILQSIPQATIESAISIRSLKKVTTSPSLTVSFTAQDLAILEESVKEYVVAKKDSNGNTIGNDSSYYVQVLYSLKCEGKCYNAQKQVVYSAVWGNGQSKFTSYHMTTRQQAEDYWKNNRESLKGNFIASVINPSIVAMGNKLSANYGPKP
ncbi:MAG TPA: hypothetical protein VGN00_29795 [Puia sp.]